MTHYIIVLKALDHNINVHVRPKCYYILCEWNRTDAVRLLINGTRYLEYTLARAHKNGRGEEERVTLIGACGAGRIFERY